MRLSRELMYAGKAWYRKEVDYTRKLEREGYKAYDGKDKASKVWLDTLYAGRAIIS